jgi:hypothetical protein
VADELTCQQVEMLISTHLACHHQALRAACGYRRARFVCGP